MSLCGLFLSGEKLEAWNTHFISLTNTVNDKPLFYMKNSDSGTIQSNVGEIILANCTNISINNFNLSFGSVGIELGYSSQIEVTNNIALSNNLYGIYAYTSVNNAVKVYSSLEMESVPSYSIWKLMRELNKPEMKKGLGFMVTFLKNMANTDTNTNN